MACSSLLAVLLQQLGRGSDGSDGSDIAGGSVSSLLRAVREVDALRRGRGEAGQVSRKGWDVVG